jgi:hypothetical protein
VPSERSQDAESVPPGWQILPETPLPHPTYFPAGLAMGAAFLFWGLITTWVVVLVGLALDAYFGTYSVDETAGTIATHLEGSISPINMGKTFVREARVVGNELIIQLKTTAVDGTTITRTNTFSRVG